MIQYAKSSTSTREDVDALQVRVGNGAASLAAFSRPPVHFAATYPAPQSGIEEVLFAKQAREYPVCPVREEVFSEAFGPSQQTSFASMRPPYASWASLTHPAQTNLYVKC